MFSVYSLLWQLLILLLTAVQFLPFSCMLTVDIFSSLVFSIGLSSPFLYTEHLATDEWNTLVNTEYVLTAWSWWSRINMVFSMALYYYD